MRYTNTPSLTTRLRRSALGKLITGLAVVISLAGQGVMGATFYWDTDGTDVGNNVEGSGLGGTGNWVTSTVPQNWWSGAGLVSWPNTDADEAVFSGSHVAGPPSTTAITVASGIVANKLSFLRSGYQLSGGDITLDGTSPQLHVGTGLTAVINSAIHGNDGLTKTGGGALRLGNSANSYTGTTTISSGTLIISNPAALGADTSAVVVTGSGTRGFGGGTLLLESGYGTGMTFTRDLSLQGRGVISDRNAALISIGNNTITGAVTTALPTAGTAQNTGIISPNGRLTIAAPLTINGTVASTFTSFGAINGTGSGSYEITGTLAGTGSIEKTGGGTMILNPSDSSGFSGTIRISSGTSVRITSGAVLGTNTGGSTSGMLDLNADGAFFEVRSDAPTIGKNVYQRGVSPSLFADHAIGSSVVNATATFGSLTYDDGETFSFNGRNGYGMTFTTATVNGGDNNSTFTNNLGGLLTFTGNFWNNTNNTEVRTFTMGGNGNTLISGNILAAVAAYDHNFTKSGSGLLTITSVGSTLDGNFSISGGAAKITDFRSITNNTGTINIGSGTTAGALIIGTSVAATAAGLTTNKVINLASTTATVSIYANQAGTNPVVLNSNFNATGGSSSNAKTVTLGGTSTADNIINGKIANNNAGGTVSLAKIGSGTWVLAGANEYTGTTTLSDGTLKLKANAATSTILPATNAITFDASNVYAGATLEFVGQANTNNVQSLGVLTPTNGAGTVKLTPGASGTASLVFASLGTVGVGGTLNIVAPSSSNTVSLASTGITNNIVNAGVFYNGADFAFVPGANLALRAPIYGTDPDFATSATALTSGQSNQITGSFSNGAVTIDSLKVNGAHTLTLTGLLTVRTAGTSNASGGIIQAGGSGTISGTGISTSGSGVLVLNVNGAGNTLTLNAPLTNAGTGGFTKVGEGTLILTAANAQTGTVNINEGTVQLSGAGRLAASNASVTMRQGATIDLNGVTPSGTTNAWNNNGTLTNSSSTAVTFTVGGTTGTGTSFGTFHQTNGVINIVKSGSGAQSWLGLSNYTGSTTISSTGSVTVDVLADIGVDSGIGRGNTANNAGSLVFNGSTGALIYAGALRDGILTLGAQSASTNRLFTLAGTGATLSSTAANNNSIVWSNPGAIVHGIVGPQSLVFTGTSAGDNRFNPQLTDSGTGANVTSVTKTGTGLWILGNSNNTYSGLTTVSNGVLALGEAGSLPAASNLVMDGGILQASGAFNRTLGTGGSQFRFTVPAANTAKFYGSFSGAGDKLTVNWGSTPTWGVTSSFLDSRSGLSLSSTAALSEVEIASGFSLGTASGASRTGESLTLASSSAVVTVGSTAGLIVGQSVTGTNVPSGAYIISIDSATQFTISANTGSGTAGTITDGAIIGSSLRTIRVEDNTTTQTDFATITGPISGDTGTGIRKVGAGVLQLFGSNTYTGETNVNGGTLVVNTLGLSTSPGATSVGDSTLGNTNAAAITLGNGGTGAAALQYVGVGETSDRKIRLFSTTGTNTIHADGSGALVLTNVANDLTVGAKTLALRGSNTGGNMIMSQLRDNGGTPLSITIDGGAVWILTNGTNDYTGTTTASAGGLGIGHDNALGLGTLALSNTNIFAFGGDRTIGNAITQGNNSTTGFIGDYSLTFTSVLAAAASANNFGTYNNIAVGKSLTLAGITANNLDANRLWNVDGSGLTIVNGNITTTSSFGVVVTKNGDGTLVLGGTGASNYNQNNANTDIDRGTLRLGVDNAIPSAAGSGGLTLSPELAATDTATFDLNGKTQVVNALTATTDGTAIIDNTAATAASFTFGANNATVNFGTGVGTYTITDSGAGALSIYKAGNTTATIPAGVTLTYQGTTGVTGGTFIIASPVNGTTGLSVVNSSTLALTGGITNPSVITSVVVGGGGTLSLLDGAGSWLSNLTNLQLGSSGGAMTTLNLNVGDGPTAGDNFQTDLFNLLSGGTLTLFTGNQITLNLTDAGLNPNQTYNLITSASGGLTSGNLSALDYILGAMPGGFTSITLNRTDTAIYITTGNLVTGSLYWRGLTNTTWNGNINNWSTIKAGTTPALTIPGAGTDVIFQWDAPTSAAVTTTLEQNFKINSLTFEASSTPANTPVSVTIDPGAIATNRLEIAPQVATDGIKITTGGPAAVAINAPLRLGANQTWHVADTGSTLTIAGGLFGEKDVTKTGPGKVVLSGATDSTFNTGLTMDFNVTEGALEITNAAALGTTVNSNLALINVSGGALYYGNGTGGTLPNSLNLSGGTLSGAAANHTYSGPVTVSSASFINMRDANGSTAVTTARNITLSGVISGAGKLTVDSIVTASAGNQLSGTLTLSNNNSGWSGGLGIVRGTVAVTNVNGLGTGAISGQGFGRITFSAAGGTTFNVNQDITLDAPSGILELNADASGTPTSDMTVNLGGVITIGSSTNANNALRISQNSDNFSIINITNSIVLGNNASISYQGSSARFLDISAVISDGGLGRSLSINDELGAWAVTSQTVRLSGQNTFSGALSVTEGTLEFSTVSNVGGAASNLGQGDGISLVGGTLRFIGSTSQTTNRPISITGTATLQANGTSGAVIEYAGPITVGTDLISPILAGTGSGVISGGITQPAGGATADLTVSSGNWRFTGANSTIADDFLINGGVVTIENTVFSLNDDIVVNGATLNLNSAGVWAANNPAGGSSYIYARNATININANDVNGMNNANQMEGFILADGTAAGTGTLNLNGHNISVPRVDVGAVAEGYDGLIAGPGTLTLTSTAVDWGSGLRLLRGLVSANLAGVSSIYKLGGGDATLSGDNSGLTSTVAATRIDAGNLILDFRTNNNNKISSVAGLDMRGGTMTIRGNAGAATSQTVNGLIVAGAGSSRLVINHGTGQTATLVMGSSIARSAVAGTIDFAYTAGSGIFESTAAHVNGAILGGWATANGKQFAIVSGGQIAEFSSTVKNDIGSWATGDNVTDSTGYSGTFGGSPVLSINSLRFGAAGATSTVNLGALGNILNVSSGGILVSSDVGAGTASITGGTLTGTGGTGAEVFIHQHNTASTFTVGARISGTTILTKSGLGTLRLTGANSASAATYLNEGTLQLSGGYGLGLYSTLILKNGQGVILDLDNGTERVGGLSGGGTVGGVVQIGTGTLITSTARTSQTYAGTITGSGTLIKEGINTQELEGDNSGFTGHVIVNGGLLHLDSTLGRINQAATITLNTAELLTDQDQSGSQDRIGNAATVILNNTATTRGLWLRNESQNAARSDTIGTVLLGAGHNVIQATNNTGDEGESHVADMVITNFSRGSNFATALVRGQALGSGSGIRGRIRPGTVPAGAVGGGGAAASTNINIVPYLIGATGVAGDETDGNVALLTGNSFVTWVSAGEGLRPLTTGEYVTDAAGYDPLSGVTTHNVRFAANPSGVLAGGSKTINSLVLDSGAAALSITGGSSDVLTIASGAILATTTTAANGIFLGGFSELRTGTAEYITYVTNAANTFTIDSALTSAASLTKSGAGTLVLTNLANGYNGGTWFNQGFIQVGALGALGTGGFNFFGGGLRWAAGTSFDPSSRTVTIGTGGAIFDTNTNDVIIANPIGNGGVGGLTKAGNGVLTLNAVSTFTGDLTVNGGTLRYGIAGAVPSTADLVLGGGTFDHQNFTTTFTGLLVNANSTITGAADLTFSGNVEINGSAARTLTINNSGLTTFNGQFFTLVDRGTSVRASTIGGTGSHVFNSQIVDGTAAGSIIFNSTGSTQLNVANTYTGSTSINNGTVTLNTPQTMTGALNFGSANTITTAGVLEVKHSSSFGSMTVQTNSATNMSQLIIDAGRTLTINGDAVIGTGVGALSTTLFNATGGGSMVVNNPAAGGTFRAGGSASNGNVTQADLSGLSSLVVNLHTTDGTFRVNSTSGTNVTGTYSLLKLPTNATITAATLSVGDGGQYTGTLNQVNQLQLGTGATTLNVNTINIGTGSRDLGSVTFQHGTNGTIKVRAADGVGAAAFNLGTGTSVTAAELPTGNRNTFDVSGHNADLLFAAVNIGTQNTRTGPMETLFVFNQGTMTTGNLTMGSKTVGGNSTNVMNLGGGTVQIGSGTGTAATLASNTSTGAVSSTINITAGDVTIGSGSGQALNMGVGNTNATGSVTAGLNISGGNVVLATTGTTAVTMATANAGTANASISITGTGILTVQGDIVRGTGAGTRNATITLNGGTLNMTGKSIGASGNAISLLAQSGTLMNLLQLNGGTGGLTKTTAGTLILEGTNSYSGGTTISGGTLQVGSGGSTGTLGSGTVTNNATLSFNRDNSYTFNDQITGNGSVVQAGTGTTVLGGASDYTGGTFFNAGTLEVNSLGAIGTVGNLTFGGGTLQHTANNATDYSGRIANSSSAIRVNTNGQSVTYGSAIAATNTAGLVKLGPGTLKLNAANLYGGTTSVSGGSIIAANTTALSTGDVNVGAGGNLIIGDTGVRQELQLGGSLSATGTLSFDIFTRDAGVNSTVNNDFLTFHSTDTLDSIDLAGTLSVSTMLDSTLWQKGDEWTLMNWSMFLGTKVAATPIYLGFASLDLPPLASGLEWNVFVTNNTLGISVVPEPSRALLLLLGLASLLMRRRRR